MNNELKELMDKLCEFTKIAKKEVDKIVQKGDLNPTELDCVYKVACVAEKIAQMTNEYSGSYSEGFRSNMQNGQMYNGSWGNEMSGARMRSPVTGRYISSGMNDGYASGHSIEDRMIASLESQMDSAKSEYERQKILEEIRRIRMSTN